MDKNEFIKYAKEVTKNYIIKKYFSNEIEPPLFDVQEIIFKTRPVNSMSSNIGFCEILLLPTITIYVEDKMYKVIYDLSTNRITFEELSFITNDFIMYNMEDDIDI